jgi:hypothetical protein
MGFKINNIDKAGENTTPAFDNISELSKQEIEYLLLLIKDSKFLGEHLEIVYNIVVKLQNQHSK